MNNQIIPLAWIRAHRYCEWKGEPMETVQDRIKAGQWIAGKHYKRTGPRTLWIHWENVNKWLDQQPHMESYRAA